MQDTILIAWVEISHVKFNGYSEYGENVLISVIFVSSSTKGVSVMIAFPWEYPGTNKIQFIVKRWGNILRNWMLIDFPVQVVDNNVMIICGASLVVASTSVCGNTVDHSAMRTDS